MKSNLGVWLLLLTINGILAAIGAKPLALVGRLVLVIVDSVSNLRTNAAFLAVVQIAFFGAAAVVLLALAAIAVAAAVILSRTVIRRLHAAQPALGMTLLTFPIASALSAPLVLFALGCALPRGCATIALGSTYTLADLCAAALTGCISALALDRFRMSGR